MMSNSRPNRMQELIAIHQLDSANLMARLERNAMGISKKTLENMVAHIENNILSVIDVLLDFKDQDGESLKKKIHLLLELFRQSITASFWYGMQYQEEGKMHKKLMDKLSFWVNHVPETIYAMPDTLKTALEGIFLSISAAIEQSIDESQTMTRSRKTTKKEV